MKCVISRALVFGTAAALLVLAGCKTEEDYRKERVLKAQKQYEAARKTDLPADKVLSLQDCIDLSMTIPWTRIT